LSFDRINVYESDNSSAVNVQYKKGDKTVVTAAVDGLSFQDLADYESESDTAYVSAMLNGSPLYLSQKKHYIDKAVFTAKWISVQRFKEALFSDPEDVLEQRNYFTNGVNSLNVSDHIIKYVNPDSHETQQNATSVMNAEEM